MKPLGLKKAKPCEIHGKAVFFQTEHEQNSVPWDVLWPDCIKGKTKTKPKINHLVMWEKVPSRAIEADSLGVTSGSGNHQTTDGWTVGRKLNKDHVSL